MKQKIGILGFSILTILSACKKNECHECHYENAQNEEIELGTYCGKDLENIEKNGISNSEGTFEVHCHEH